MNRAAVAVGVVVIVVVVTLSTYLLFYTPTSTPKRKGLSVIATFYPIYDFASNVCLDKANVTILVPETLDVHDFDPTPLDIQRVANADILIYNGAGLEPWIPDLVKAVGKPSLVVIDTSVGIAPLQAAPEFQRGNHTIDPHIWLDPLNAEKQVENIAQGMENADPANAQAYASNAAAYEAKLDTLNREILTNTTSTKTRVFVTFHEAFAYFAKRYNLTQIPIQGPFQEEPTPTDIQNVVNVIKQYRLHYVGYESLENPAISEAVSAQTNATLILMDPIEGLTQADKIAGKNYLSLMREDSQNIAEALDNVG